ncbi:uncharacterized protein LOC120358728 [Solenopsis invicta]|uniref:uncharacterized protein LOC120358728 n=1 Tax=Solenopsis invicta TaxID=13686 RepID=UPI00193DEE61|nr:uncharacterized protein LOC120358728 [Solenopsis invicta]
MDKLVLAEDTSNIDMSPDKLHKQNKIRRRMKAKKKYLSHSSSSDKNEDDCVRSNKSLPDIPQIGNFVSSNKQHINKSRNSISKNNTISSDDIDIPVLKNNIERNFAEKPNEDVDKENYTCEFKKIVLAKMNKVIFQLYTLENKMNILEEKIQPTNTSNEENDIQLPITTFEELIYFEEQLHEIQFKNELLNVFERVGGPSAHIMIRNIMKKTITNTFAQNFSWAGKKTKKSFKT